MRTIDRRKFIARSTIASIASFSNLSDVFGEGEAPQSSSYNLKAEVAKYSKIDAYTTAPINMKTADLLGIQTMFVGLPMRWTPWTPTEFIAANNQMIALMDKYPGRVIGQISLNPLFTTESLREIDRCAEKGMIGTRLYYHVKINDPLYYPIIEKLSALNMLIFCHGEAQKGVGGYRMKYDVDRPSTISTPDDFVEVAQRFPEAMFHFAHIGGGGDWEYMCRSFEAVDNVYVDLGGSNNEENMVNLALESLGEDRLFFGTDNSYYQSIGKILSAELSETQKEKIFSKNYLAVLKKGGYYVD